MKKLLAVLLFVPSLASAVWKGQFDATTNPDGVLYRELHDGNWVGGLEHVPFHILHNGIDDAHIGYGTVWRANYGDPGLFLSPGVNVPQQIAHALDLIQGNWDLPTVFPPSALAGMVLSVDYMVGWRFHHGPDVHSFIHGPGVRLTIPVDTILKKIGIGM